MGKQNTAKFKTNKDGIVSITYSGGTGERYVHNDTDFECYINTSKASLVYMYCYRSKFYCNSIFLDKDISPNKQYINYLTCHMRPTIYV